MKLEQLAVTVASEVYQVRGSATPIADMSQLIFQHLRAVRDATARECAEMVAKHAYMASGRDHAAAIMVRFNLAPDATGERGE